MQIPVCDIDARGRDVRFDLEHGQAVQAASSVLEAPVSALVAELHFSAQGTRVQVEGTVDAQAPRVCERCGEDMVLRVHAPVELVYVPEAQQADQDRDLQAEELDIGWYADGVIDPVDVLSEALALALPERVACDTVACDTRTHDLLAARGQAGDPAHSAFAALKHLT